MTSKPDNSTIARALVDLADTMEVGGEPAFKVRAFRGAARAIEGLAESAVDLLQAGTLTSIKGVGSGVARRVAELVEHGDIAELVERRDRLPPGLRELLKVPGVGLKTAELVWREAHVADVAELTRALEGGELDGLRGFGPKRLAKLRSAIDTYYARADEPTRTPVTRAARWSRPLLEMLDKRRDVQRVELAGSYRRRCETVGDLDVLVAAELTDAPAIMKAFAAHSSVAEVLVTGDKKTSVRLSEGVQVDCRVVEPDAWGAALQYFTGSKEHNVALRSRAVAQGLTVNEYGVWDATGARVAGSTEEDVYASLGLAWIPPELREDWGEIEAASRKDLPEIVREDQLSSDLHLHTVASDGRSTLDEMCAAAEARGLRLLAVTEHSQSLTIAQGLSEEKLREQMNAIRNGRDVRGVLVWAGVETDILPDGRLDFPIALLDELDWVVGSVHTQFALDRERQTQRIVAAIRSGAIDCVGHPTGRMLTRRPGMDFDLDAVIDAAVEMEVALELNGAPLRLDLDERALRRACERGATFAINSDAHHTSQLAYQEIGVGIARRARLPADRVINTWEPERIQERRTARIAARRTPA